MVISLSAYSRLLLRFSFRHNDTFLLPFSKDVPVKKTTQTKPPGPATGKLLLERPMVNAEFLPDFLREEEFFLQKFYGQLFTNTGRAALLFEYGRKEKRVRHAELARETQMQLLGEAAWGMRVYENPAGESFPICINLACRKPYFSLAGEFLHTRPEFILQKKDGLIIFGSVVESQISAA